MNPKLARYATAFREQENGWWHYDNALCNWNKPQDEATIWVQKLGVRSSRRQESPFSKRQKRPLEKSETQKQAQPTKTKKKRGKDLCVLRIWKKEGEKESLKWRQSNFFSFEDARKRKRVVLCWTPVSFCIFSNFVFLRITKQNVNGSHDQN